ncbi:MAG: nucleotidyltransferase [Candidatus Hydrothermales bacterium]
MGLKELIKNISKELNKKNINYMIIGGQALLIYGEPRLTKDIDITLGIGVERYEEIKEISDNLGLKIIPKNYIDFLKKTMVLPVLDEKTGIRIDFIFSFSEYEKEALKRVNKIKIDEVQIFYASIEDLIIHKIVSGRERDLEDVKSILLKNKEVDEKYILKWLKEFEKILNEKLIERFKKLKGEIN